MASGPEHYAAAEDCLERAQAAWDNASEETDDVNAWRARHFTAKAHVHALLAGVAAQVAHSGNSVPKVWAEVLKP